MIRPIHSFIIFIFLFGSVFSVESSDLIKGRILKINPAAQTIYTTLNNNSISVGDYVGAYNEDSLILYLQVVGTSDRISKCTLIKKDAFNNMNHRFGEVHSSSWVTAIDEQQILAYEKSLQQLKQKEHLLVEKIKQPLTATLGSTPEIVSDEMSQALLVAEDLNYNAEDLVTQLRQEQAEKETLQAAVDDLKFQYNDLNQLKDKYYNEAQILRQKQVKLKEKLDQMSKVIESHIHASKK